MSKTPWTSGPWVIRDGNDNRRPALYIKQEYRDAICVLPDYDESNAAANARLIAEAPAMADALEALVNKFGGTIATSPDDPRAIAAVAILARIKGEG